MNDDNNNITEHLHESIKRLDNKKKVDAVKNVVERTDVPACFMPLIGIKRKLFYRTDGNNEERREWIHFEDNKFFCIYCLAFSAHTNHRLIDGVNYTKGCRISEILSKHDNEAHHVLSKNVYIDSSSNDGVNTVHNSGKWMALTAILKIIIFLATHGLAMFGTDDNLQSVDLRPDKSYFRDQSGNGVFTSMVKLHASACAPLQDHLMKCQEMAKNGYRNYICFLSNSFVRSALLAIRNMLVEKIVEDIHQNGGCFGLLADGTQDISVKEQNSLVVRYVDSSNTLAERTVLFLEAVETTGAALFLLFSAALNSIGLSIRSITGCSFDGALNFRSENTGLVAHIRKENPKCVFTWCLSHRFNLCVVKGSSIIRISGILTIAETSAKLFRSSHKKMDVWVEVVKKTPNVLSGRRLHMIGQTRWSSRQDAISAIVSSETHIYVLIKSLIKLCSLRGLDGQSLATACSNLNDWLDYSNVVAAFILHTIYGMVSPTTKYLQTCGLFIGAGFDNIASCYQKLEESKKHLQEYIASAEILINKTNSLLSSDTEIQSVHFQMLIRSPTGENRKSIIDNIISDFVLFIGTMQNEIYSRILSPCLKIDGILYELKNLDPHFVAKMSNGESMAITNLSQQVQIDEQILSRELKTFSFDYIQNSSSDKQYELVFENFDTDGEDQEGITVIIENTDDAEETLADLTYATIRPMFNSTCSCPECLMKYICATSDRTARFKNVFKLLKYVLTLPATQVQCERDFSKLKRIKSRLRSGSTENTLQNLMIIACNASLFDSIDINDIAHYVVSNSKKLALYINS